MEAFDHAEGAAGIGLLETVKKLLTEQGRET
jgi:hypothetical protein